MSGGRAVETGSADMRLVDRLPEQRLLDDDVVGRIVGTRRASMYQAGPVAGSLPIPPSQQSLAQVIGVHAEQVANIVKGEGTFVLLGADPGLGLDIELPALGITCVKVLLKALDRVLDDRDQQTVLST